MKFLPIILMVTALFAGCCQEDAMDMETARESMLAADREFSKLSVEQGMYNAFDTYMDDNATIYREGQHPYTGREAIRPLFPQEGGGTLAWEPFMAEIAESGDLGYTLGKWTYTLTAEDGSESISQGYYVSIWKKQADSSWKYVFDTGVSVKNKEK